MLSTKNLTDQQLVDAIREKRHTKNLTDQQLADALGEKRHTIRVWRKNGIIPYRKITYRTIRFDLTAVEAALAKFEVREVAKRNSLSNGRQIKGRKQ